MRLRLLFLSFAVALILFWVGFHNIDLAYNFSRLGYTQDCSFDGCTNLENVYLKGMGAIIIAQIFFIITIIIALGRLNKI
jgi:hypothetical protein